MGEALAFQRKMYRWSPCALAFVLTTSPAIASGDEATSASGAAPISPASVGDDRPRAPPPKGPDYRVPMLLSDIVLTAGVAVSATVGVTDYEVSPTVPTVVTVASFAGFVASGALYHEGFDLQKQTGRSVLTRTVAPAVASLTFLAYGMLVCPEWARSECLGVQMVAGATLGMVSATVIEMVNLVPAGRKPPPASTPTSAFSVVPTVGGASGGAQLGLGGTF